MTIKWRHAWDEKADAQARKETDIDCSNDPLMTEQDGGIDINVLLKRFGVTDGATLPRNLGVTDPSYYGDWDSALDLRSIMHASEQAAKRFKELPADIRARFQNDPLALYEFVTDDTNREEAEDLGLLTKTPPAKPAEQREIPPDPPK